MSKYNELVKKLKEIFQIDRPELDFGIYRILNAKADEINNYLENTLKRKISDALATAGNANKEELEKQLSTAIKAAEDAGFDPEDSPKVKDLRQQILTTSQSANEHENAVFTHLLSFFSRYYDSGDFVSKRRYKGDTYAIPYAGEEVMLHWANKDQYYIKSGENFANYSFKLDDGRKVSFKLLTADTAKDNRKDNDADRRFVLIEPHFRTKLDDEGNEFEEEYQPVTVIKSGDADELIIQFEYKAVKKGTKQDALVLEALQTVLANEQVQTDWVAITNREPTDKNPNRTLLEKHLTTYTQRNTADYFIHKDLGGFLSNELDFYIKNEVMNLDNLQNAEVFADIEKQLRMIQCLRSIASDVIKFLAQLENFQRKLWTKRKFVYKANYCISLDRITKDLYDELLLESKLIDSWKKLGFIKKNQVLNSEVLLNMGGLIVDTELVSRTIKEKIINSIDNIETNLSGELISSDNYQALRLLSNKYKASVDTVYIDPPYNTSDNAFLYKNTYKHSSWNSLILNTTPLAYELLKSSGTINAAIDDTEYSSFKSILSERFGSENYVGTIAIEVNPAGQNIRPNVPARSHDYSHIFAKNIDKITLIERGLTKEERKQYKEKDGNGAFYWDNLRRRGGNSRPTDRPKQWYPLFVNGKQVRVPEMDWEQVTEKWIVRDSLQAGETEHWPIDPKNIDRIWRTNPDGARREIEKGEIEAIEKAGRIEISKKSREPSGKKPKTLWADSKYSATSYGSKHLINLFGDSGQFNYPKSINLVTDSIRNWARESSVVLDYFAGSGTTAEAILRLNKEDNGNRKVLLAEQGAYFDLVTKPRVLKCAFSPDWKNGTPSSTNDYSSVIYKVMRIESYEDTLNNLEVKKSGQQLSFMEDMPVDVKEDYLLNYMLETESKGSLLSTDDFKNPFDYKMKIAVNSAGACEEQNIDLVETFNYLIGLHVNTIESNLDKGYVRIEGKLPSGERALVLWRDCEKIQYDDFTKFASRFDLFAKQKTFDVIYVNGDHNLPTAFTNDEGEVTRTLKLRQIEPEFLEQMFAPDELA